MTLTFAQRCAEKLLDWLRPFCERIEVAGSIRRERPIVGDIDLVVLPRIQIERDLFDKPCSSLNLCDREIDARIQRDSWVRITSGDNFRSWMARNVQVDLWFATPDTFGTLLMCRTGSKEHNIWLAQRALDHGGKWNPHHGLYLQGKRHSETEQSIYEALALPWINPRDREIERLRCLHRSALATLKSHSGLSSYPPAEGA